MPKDIFREYDIRGLVDKDLTEERVELIGKAYGTLVNGNIAVGRDIRTSSEKYSKALIKGLRSTGCNIIDIGISTTPLLYFSIHQYEQDGGIMITGSHNPIEYNGLKLCKGLMSLHGKDIQEIRKVVEKGEFKQGEGTIQEKNPLEQYHAYIKDKIKLGKKLKVVIDSGNGTAGPVALKLLKDLGCEVVPLYCDPDGTFPNHLPDPTVVEYVQDLIAKVKEENADVGIGYDGDADRIGMIDEKGNIIYGDNIMMLLSEELQQRKPGSKVIFDVKCSSLLADEIKRQGGVPIMWKTGHSLIKSKMHEEKAELAGEMSGHIFFNDRFLGFDDAIYASCRLLEILSNTDKKASQLLEHLPKTYNTPEIRVDCPEDKKFLIPEELKKEIGNEFNIYDIDGARIHFEDGWGLVRASNTQPVLVLRFEAQSPERLQEIQNFVENKVELIKNRL
ncbi:MAG: phosphomannomutase/phosphoglucomutase [Nanoarchaeota archaeon]|nr:phosphomannomutase/phosphoglucomutase [Nanoarchaeota archaeon]MCG2717480.1 phosphomannomutase/phosphoglucomutase [Nanoarchaeota archaeon]